MSHKNDYSEEFFQERAQFPSALFKGRDLSFLKYPFWDSCIRRRATNGKLLDIGCAEGAFLKWAERRNYETYGLDISEFALGQITGQRVGQTGLLVADVSTLPFTDSCFDIITCFDVLEHIEEPLIALSEINRILKEGGLFMVSTPNISSVGLQWKGENWYGYHKTHVSLLSSKVWCELFANTGFKILDVFYDTLWDTPYFNHVPTLLQHLFFKPLLLLFYCTPIRFSEKWGENLFLIAVKSGERIDKGQQEIDDSEVRTAR